MFPSSFRGRPDWESFEICDLYGTIAPLGFDPEPKFFFGHAEMLSPDDKTVDFPYANTCANAIRLPVLDSNEKFKNNMMVAMEIVTTFTNE